MKKIKSILILIFIFFIPKDFLFCQENPQNNYVPFNPAMIFGGSSDNKSIPMKTQAQIDSMQIAGEGYIVLNVTTGCFNYYINQKWHELCGECLPQPKIPKIDSIISKNSKVFIYFQPIKMDSLKAQLGKSRAVSQQSPLVLYLKEQTQNPAPLQLSAYTLCGSKDTIIEVNISSSAKFSPILTEEVDGKKIRYRKYGNCKWMIDDYIVEKPAMPKSPYWVSMENTKNPCPKGWIVPTEKDWLILLENFEGNYSALLDTPTDENLSLGLNKYGFYILQEKKVLGEGTASYWVGEKKGNKHKLINITDNGYIVPEEDPKLFMIPLRCIQCEK